MNVNAASAEELDRLPGVGPKVAQNIIHARGKAPFAVAADLQRVAGIGRRTLERIQAAFTLEF